MSLEKMRKPLSRKALAHKIIGKRVKDPEPESDWHYKYFLYRIIDVCGAGFAWKIYDQMRKIEKRGGMMTSDGSRRRTPFGIFCHLATQQMNSEDMRRLQMTPSKMKVYDAAQRMKRRIREAIAQAERPLVSAAPMVEQEIVPEPETIEAVQAPAPQAATPQPESKKQPNGKANKPTGNKKPYLPAARQARFQMPVAESSYVPDDLPPAVRSKLQQLQGAANVLRERVQQLESKPAGEQVGLEMARKLLTNTEGQINALLAEHERSGEVAS